MAPSRPPVRFPHVHDVWRRRVARPFDSHEDHEFNAPVYCEPRCGLIRAPSCSFSSFFFLNFDISCRPTARDSLTPMGNICGSTATAPSDPQPRPPVTVPRPSAPAALQPNIKEESPVPSSSRPPSRPRSHSSASRHESTQHIARPSQDPIPRTRTKSAPQPPQAFKSSSPQGPRPRARSVVQSKRSSRSDSRTTGPGETN